MPINYRIDHEKRLVLARAYGKLTYEEVFAYQHEAWSGKDMIGYNELFDFSDVSGFEVPSGERVQSLATLAASMDPGSTQSRLAIVAPGDLAYGIGRMFQTYRGLESAGTKEVGVFRILGDALEFLDIRGPLPLPPLTATEEK